jgi:hypothetical protein
MEWTQYKHGKLAKCDHGHYFVYKKKVNEQQNEERWFAEYESGSGPFREQGTPTGDTQGFETLEEASRDCEENALVLKKALEH